MFFLQNKTGYDVCRMPSIRWNSIPPYPSQELLYYLLRQMRPGDAKKSSLQTVQAGEGRLFRMNPFDAFPRFRWPHLLEFLLRPDPNLVEQLFGFRSDIHQVRKSP